MKKIIKVLFVILGVSGAIFWSVGRSDVHLSHMVHIACPGDYPGGCLSNKGIFMGKEIDIIKEMFGDEKIKFVQVSASHLKHAVSQGMFDIGCGGWVIREDNAIYSDPIITNIQICDILYGENINNCKVFVQSGTLCAKYAKDRYTNLKKFDDLMDCIREYNACQDANKRIILDSINFDYLKEYMEIQCSYIERYGDYSIALVCKDNQTKMEVNLRISKYFQNSSTS